MLASSDAGEASVGITEVESAAVVVLCAVVVLSDSDDAVGRALQLAMTARAPSRALAFERVYRADAFVVARVSIIPAV
ncbi:MAG: hypothetical protein AAGF11_53155 [Myxococcota bacterium]